MIITDFPSIDTSNDDHFLFKFIPYINNNHAIHINMTNEHLVYH